MGFFDFFSWHRNRVDLSATYAAIMRKARQPEHYGAGGVPDSFDGRFDMLALHVHLVLRRLRSDGVARDEIGQTLFDLFFQDMDQAMREAGIGDLGVGKKIRKMAQAFYGRAAAYDAALGKHSPASNTPPRRTALEDVLRRNLYPDDASAADAARLGALAVAVLAMEKQLAACSLNDVLAGNLFNRNDDSK